MRNSRSMFAERPERSRKCIIQDLVLFGAKKGAMRPLPDLSIIPKQWINQQYCRTNRPAECHRQHSDEKLNAANRQPVAHSHV